MATFSAAARNAAIDAIVLLLETGGSFARPALRSLDAGANQIHFTFFTNTSPLAATFNAASGGIATKFILPWGMPVTTTTTRTLDTWQLRSQANVTEITGTWGLPASGADIEIDELDVLVGHTVQLDSFALAMV